MAGVAGMTYNALVRRVCEVALAPRTEVAADLWMQSLHLSGLR